MVNFKLQSAYILSLLDSSHNMGEIYVAVQTIPGVLFVQRAVACSSIFAYFLVLPHRKNGYSTNDWKSS